MVRPPPYRLKIEASTISVLFSKSVEVTSSLPVENIVARRERKRPRIPNTIKTFIEDSPYIMDSNGTKFIVIRKAILIS